MRSQVDSIQLSTSPEAEGLLAAGLLLFEQAAEDEALYFDALSQMTEAP